MSYDVSSVYFESEISNGAGIFWLNLNYYDFDLAILRIGELIGEFGFRRVIVFGSCATVYDYDQFITLLHSCAKDKEWRDELKGCKRIVNGVPIYED